MAADKITVMYSVEGGLMGKEEARLQVEQSIKRIFPVYRCL